MYVWIWEVMLLIICDSHIWATAVKYWFMNVQVSTISMNSIKKCLAFHVHILNQVNLFLGTANLQKCKVISWLITLAVETKSCSFAKIYSIWVRDIQVLSLLQCTEPEVYFSLEVKQQKSTFWCMVSWLVS